MEETEYKVILVDDHALFRNGLRGLLNGRQGCTIAGEASSGEDFLQLIYSTDGDIVLMDIDMPGMNGIEATEKSLKIKPDLKIITLSMHGDEEYYFKMVEAGAKGFLLKNSDLDEVINAIKTVAEGGSYFSQELLYSLVGSLRSTNVSKDPTEDQLSEREKEILLLICKGLSNQEIGDKLFISKRTVDKHRANILLKTNSKNTANLVVYAIKNSIVEI